MSKPSWPGRALAGLPALLMPTAAFAHSPIKGIGTVYSFMLHAVVVPGQALVLVATGLLLGQQSRETARSGVIAFALGIWAGLAGAGSLQIDSLQVPVLLTAALLIGGAVSLGFPLPRWLCLPLALGAGALIGLDSFPGALGATDTPLAYAGLILGAPLFALMLAGNAHDLPQPWMRIGVRVVGSWTVAASAMVLALSFRHLA